MKDLRNFVLILGEGPTEVHYFKSLADIFKGFQIQPDSLKHTSVKELGERIAAGIKQGYSHVFCVVDMDTKQEGREKSKYEALKKKYASYADGSRGCEIRFFESYRCTEIFFLYYFCYTSKEFTDQVPLITELNKYCPYDKTFEFFKKGLNQWFEKHGGSLENAIHNAELSVAARASSGGGSYSELGRMLNLLKDLQSTK